MKRARTFEELQSRIKELKGVKKLNYNEKLHKKYMENKIKRKMKKKERLLQKALNKAKKNTAEGDAIKIENKDEQKIPKRIFNSEGKMVFNKFDFSEIGVKKKLPKNDPKKMLHQLQENKEKFKQLKESGDTEKAEDLKKRNTWKFALARVNGEKVCQRIIVSSYMYIHIYIYIYIYKNIFIYIH